MAFAPGDVVRAHNGSEAVVVLSRAGVLTVLCIVPTRRATRRSDVALYPDEAAGLTTNRPIVRCDRTTTISADKVEFVASLSLVTSAAIAASVMRERITRAAEDRFHYARCDRVRSEDPRNGAWAG